MRKFLVVKLFVVIIVMGGVIAPCLFAQMQQDVKDKMLQRHNQLRHEHNAPALKWNNEIASVAQQWATKVAGDNKMTHRPNNKYGENIFVTSCNPISGAQPVDAWYSEIKDYSYGSTKFSTVTGHFTQVVWVGSKEVGCGQAKSNKNMIYVVCNYSPPGNYNGKFKDNILKSMVIPTENRKAADLGNKAAMGAIIKQRIFAMGGGVVFIASFPEARQGYWRSATGYQSMEYGDFKKVGPNKVGYFCPRLGSVVFTINSDSIVWEVNEATKKTVKSFVNGNINSKGVVKRN
jgi:hypothetical protein